MTDERSRQAVEIAELSADGGAEESEELYYAHLRAEVAFEKAIEDHDYEEQERNPRAEVCCVAVAATDPEIQIGAVCCAAFEAAPDPMSQERASADLLRDIFGNPFRPVTFSPEWRTDTAVALARQMYESRDFSAMAILADALQDAGCDNEDVLSHCRGPGPHVRGCWVVDLVLGKE
jgi:hypothetical protein